MIILLIDILFSIWSIFFAYWLGSIMYESLTKKTKHIKKRESLLILFINRLFLYGAVFLIFITPDYLQYFPFDVRIFPKFIGFTYFGLGIVIIGIIFAIWARFTLGTNWSADPVLKKGQILITNGPYNIVRHPIYSGLTFAVIGSIIVENALTGLISLLSILVFSYLRIKEEEGLMKIEFGKEYDEYTKTVKIFVPWLW